MFPDECINQDYGREMNLFETESFESFTLQNESLFQSTPRQNGVNAMTCIKTPFTNHIEM